VHEPEAQTVNAVSLDPAMFADDVVHESAKHVLEQRKKYARWLDSANDLVMAKAMLIIIGRAMNMFNRQTDAQGDAFEAHGVLPREPHRSPPRRPRRRANARLRLPRLQSHPPDFLTFTCTSGILRTVLPGQD